MERGEGVHILGVEGNVTVNMSAITNYVDWKKKKKIVDEKEKRKNEIKGGLIESI